MVGRKEKGGDAAYIQKRNEAQREKKERSQRETKLGAIHRITDALNSTQTQDQTDDDKRAFREKLTIGLLIATVIAAAAGDVIFYLTMEDNQASLVESERAWAGPDNAKLDGAVELGKSAEVIISVRNSGKEPATDFTYSALPFVFDSAKNLPLDTIIRNSVDECFKTVPVERAQVLYPANAFGSGFEFRTKFSKESIDQGVIDGTTDLIVTGCLSYSTFGQPKHSAFCYFYNAKATKQPNNALNLCTGASQAD